MKRVRHVPLHLRRKIDPEAETTYEVMPAYVQIDKVVWFKWAVQGQTRIPCGIVDAPPPSGPFEEWTGDPNPPVKSST